MKNFALHYEGNNIVAYNKLLFESFPLELFDPSCAITNPTHDNKDEKIHHGRGSIHSFEYNNEKLILRHYHRGGLPAKLIRDKYFWTSLEKSRAMQELQMLSAMQQFDLPVPTPAAARVYKNILTYQADLVTVLIPNSKTLSSILMSESLTDNSWQRIGEVIKKFHQHNCNHADLNAHNIMLDGQGDVYLIDFDNSSINASAGKWQASNLQRLKRSLEKLANNSKEFNYTAIDFSSLMQGYAA